MLTQPDQVRIQRLRHDFGDFGLAHTGRPFEQQWLLQRHGQKGGHDDMLVGDVALAFEQGSNVVEVDLRHDTAEALRSVSYSCSQSPLSVNFRQMRPEIGSSKRVAHTVLAIAGMLRG